MSAVPFVPVGADPAEIAVTLHRIEPATFERSALIRDWLADHDIARATLLVVPATDVHPLADRSTRLVDWLLERRSAGDAIGQCAFTGSCAAHCAGRPVISAGGLQASAAAPAARRRAALRAPLLCVDLTPDLRPRHVRALDELLSKAAGRRAVTAPEIAVRFAGREGRRARQGASAA